MNRNVSWNLVPSSRTAWSAVKRNVSVHAVLGAGSNGQVLQNPSAPGPLALKWNAFPAADAAVAESATASSVQRTIEMRRMTCLLVLGRFHSSLRAASRRGEWVRQVRRKFPPGTSFLRPRHRFVWRASLYSTLGQGVRFRSPGSLDLAARGRIDMGAEVRERTDSSRRILTVPNLLSGA